MTKPEVRNKFATREAVAQKIWLIIEDEIGIDVSEYNEKSRFIEDMHID